MSISGGQRLRRSDVRRERKELLLSVERGNKADIQTYSSGHLGPRSLNPMSVHCQRDKPIWKGSVYSEFKLSGPSRLQESQAMETNVEEMIDTMSNFTMATTLQEPKDPSSTGSPGTLSWTTSVDPYKTGEVLDTTELFLVKPSKRRPCAPAEEVDQGRYWCTHSCLAGLTRSDRLQQWKLFDRQVVRKQDLMTRNCLSGRGAAQRHEHKLQQALKRVPVCRGLSRERLRVFSDVFSDMCDDSPALGSILREIKMEYDLYLNSAISSESSFQDMSALMPLGALSGTAELEEATRQVSLLEEEARRALEANDRVRTEYEDAQAKATGNQNEEAIEEAVLPDVKHTETEGSSMAQVEWKRQQVWKMCKEMQSLQKEIRDTMVSTVTTSSLEGCIRDTKAEIIHLVSRNKRLRSTNKLLDKLWDVVSKRILRFLQTVPSNVSTTDIDLEQNILKVLHRAKVSEEAKAQVCEKIWTTMNADD